MQAFLDAAQNLDSIQPMTPRPYSGICVVYEYDPQSKIPDFLPDFPDFFPEYTTAVLIVVATV